MPKKVAMRVISIYAETGTERENVQVPCGYISKSGYPILNEGNFKEARRGVGVERKRVRRKAPEFS